MSLVQQPLPAPIPLQESSFLRKRTSSFSYPQCDSTLFPPSPRPSKAPRVATSSSPMGSPLRRTETLLSIPSSTNGATTTATTTNKTRDAECYRVLSRHKDERLRRNSKGLTRTHSEYFDFTTSRPRLEVTPPCTAAPTIPLPSKPAAPSAKSAVPPKLNPKPRKSPPPAINTTPSIPSTPLFTPVYTKKRAAPSTPPQLTLPSASCPIPVLRTQRSSSPLNPAQHPLPGRPVFPRSKPEPDLYRTAIKMRMRGSPEGLRVLHMGPRLAMSIMNATRELEKIVADQTIQERDRDNDVIMADATSSNAAPTSLVSGSSGVAGPVLTASWVVVKGEDWEMVDCAA